MSWEAIGAVGEVVGAIGVIATLAYLSVQIRHSSKVGMATVQQNVHDGHQLIYTAVLDNQDLMRRFMAGESLDDREQTDILNLYLMLTDSHQNYFLHHKLGLFDDESLTSMQPRLIILFGTPSGRQWLEENKEHYRRDFVEYVFNLLERDGRSTNEVQPYLGPKSNDT